MLSTAGEETHRVWRPGYFNDLGRTFTNTFDRHVEDILTALRVTPTLQESGEGRTAPCGTSGRGRPRSNRRSRVPGARSGRRAVELAAASVRSFDDGVRVMT